jgi:hypothetical protein
MTVVRPSVPEGVSWLDAALRVPDRFTLTRSVAFKGGYHNVSDGRVSAMDYSLPVNVTLGQPAPSQCGSCVAGLPMACSCPTTPPPVRVELGHSGYRLVRDDTAAFLEVDDPKSIQIGDPDVSYNPFNDPTEAARRTRFVTATDRLLSSADAARRQAQALDQARRILAAAQVPADIVLRRPKWLPGDVIVVEYAPGKPYTYVRGEETWPVDKGRTPKTDDDINALYELGKVRPVLQSGGVAFHRERLPR